jgi:hypothetical protein
MMIGCGGWEIRQMQPQAITPKRFIKYRPFFKFLNSVCPMVINSLQMSKFFFSKTTDTNVGTPGSSHRPKLRIVLR